MPNVFGTDVSETINSADGVTNAADTIFGIGGNDNIYGLGGNDQIKGGGGADYIDGGSGIDTATYSDSWTGVSVNLGAGATNSGGTAQGDVLVNIENLNGSSYADTLIGNAGNNMLGGLEGNDILKGGGGADTLYGDSGSDTLKGGGGADTLNGGSGIDTASYNDSTAGVFVSLYTDQASGGYADGDELNSIESLTGSAYNDTLWGNDGVNVLNGNNGNDNLKGYGGADTLYGGDGEDYLDGMEGDDTLRGENGNDTLRGANGHDIIFGGANNDTLIGGIGFMDFMNGEAGVDVFKFETIEDCGLATASADQLPDFNEAAGEKIDLSVIDANTLVGGNQAFTWIGNDNAFSGAAGELRYNTAGYVEGDVNGDATADFFIAVNIGLNPVMHDYGFVL